MLTSVRIQNFRCLKDVTLELGPLTVFVGPNASGKTAIADCLTQGEFDLRADSWCHDLQNPIALTPTYDSESPEPAIRLVPVNTLTSDGGLTKRYVMGFDKLRLKGLRRKFNLSISAICEPSIANEEWTLDSSGSNLANFFDTLSRDVQGQFVSDFTRLVPMYSDVKARAYEGKKRLLFQDRWHSDVWYEPDQVSDGTLITAVFVAMTYQQDPPDLAVVEDPERGLHPYLQQHIVAMLRNLAEGKIGDKSIQIVCTTHSRALLDYLEPDEVRFITRSRETGETQVQKAPIDNPRWQDVYEKYQESLGNMWMTGALGGVPGA